jgi:vesicle transport through interaction with t-SNAREs protein 1
MELAANGLDSGLAKTNAIDKLRAFRNDLNRFRSDLITLKKDFKAKEIKSARERLFADFEPIAAGSMDPASDASQALLSNSQSATGLDRTQRMALEAEQVGANVLIDLRKQREQLQNAQRTLVGTDQDLDASNRILREMLRRMKANKLFSMIIIVLLVVVLFMILFAKIFH